MAIFSNKQILKAVFTNNANDTIELVYNHKNDGETPEYISIWIPATDPTNENLIALKTAGWSFERIQKETHNYLEQRKNVQDARMYQLVESKVKEQLDHYYQIINEEANARVKEELDKYYAIVNEEANARVKEELDKYYAIAHEEADARVKEELDKYYAKAHEESQHTINVTKEKIAQIYEQRYNEFVDAGPVVTSNILQGVISANFDEDTLFKTKLAVFDLPEIKNVKDRALKQKIRTSKTLLELFGVLGTIYKTPTATPTSEPATDNSE
jgi:hypothetical protein